MAGKSEQLATLLDHALLFHKAHGDGPCPVCGKEKALDSDWHQRKAQEAADLRQAAKEATEARKAVDAAQADDPQADGRRLGPRARGPSEVGLLSPRGRRLAVPRGVRNRGVRRSVVRRPLSNSVRPLLMLSAPAKTPGAPKPSPSRMAPEGRQALVVRPLTLPLLKKAEKWLKDAADDIRNERFAPIADETRRIWDKLRLQSNVSLDDVHLGGAGKARKVELNVTVDGQEGAALGVMSQGELHSLALSLFIPRATLEESPFRFVVIDDPVQSMDPARVDGLAHVLQSASKNRQVVVFTHDDRLPEAIRRLDIPATVIEVTRREGSVVEPRRSKDPVSRYIEDAMALAYTDDLPAEVARRVVPGLCREALEAACMEAIRRRRIGRGEPHAEVEALLAEGSEAPTSPRWPSSTTWTAPAKSCRASTRRARPPPTPSAP